MSGIRSRSLALISGQGRWPLPARRNGEESAQVYHFLPAHARNRGQCLAGAPTPTERIELNIAPAAVDPARYDGRTSTSGIVQRSDKRASEVRPMRNEFTAIVERDGDWVAAYCPEVPGANGQRRT